MTRLTNEQTRALGEVLCDTDDDIELGLAQLGIDSDTVSQPDHDLWRLCSLRQCRECGMWCRKTGPLHDCVSNAATKTASHTPVIACQTEPVETIRKCACGKPVAYSCESRCEDCFSNDQLRSDERRRSYTFG